MQRARWERELDSEILSDLHYLKQYVLPLFQLGGYVPDLKIKVDKDIEAAVAELVETDPDGTLLLVTGWSARSCSMRAANSSTFSRSVS